jgi:hypothetical protein
VILKTRKVRRIPRHNPAIRQNVVLEKAIVEPQVINIPVKTKLPQLPEKGGAHVLPVNIPRMIPATTVKTTPPLLKPAKHTLDTMPSAIAVKSMRKHIPSAENIGAQRSGIG